MWKPLLSLLIASASFADEPLVPPFDAKKAKAILDERRAWHDKNIRRPYAAVGNRDPKWDALVDKALELEGERHVANVWARHEAEASQRDFLRKAVAAGCDDPFVWFLTVRAAPVPIDGLKKLEHHKLLSEAADAVLASKYPAACKGEAVAEGVKALAHLLKTGNAVEDELEPILAVALDAAGDLAADPSPTARLMTMKTARGGLSGIRDERVRKKWVERFEARVGERQPKGSPLADALAGANLVGEGWDARGWGPGWTVTQRKSAQFQNHLSNAERRMKGAWETDNEFMVPALALITIGTGRGHDRETVDLWFRRAVAADPTDFAPFSALLAYLTPKWHGSEESLLEFAKAATDANRWDTPLPLLVAVVHMVMANESGNPVGYFSSRPGIWATVEPSLEELRKRHPSSGRGAATYLFFAYLCKKNAPQAHAYVTAQKYALPDEDSPFPFKADEETAKKWAKTNASRKK